MEKSKKENKRLQSLNLYDKEHELVQVVSALSVPTRREIIKLINEKPLSVNEIAWKLNIPVSTASFHVKTLVKAGLLNVSTGDKKITNQKIVSLGNYFYTLHLGNTTKPVIASPSTKVRTIEVPIGSYSSFSVEPTCGIHTPEGTLLVADTPATFSSPERFKAGLIWVKRGFLQYSVPLLNYNGSRQTGISFDDKNNIISLSFTFEMCAETINYDHNCKSLISFTVNDKEVCKIKLNGDFGQRRGKLNPDWMGDNTTQYGLLHNVDIRLDGCYLNEKKVSEICISDLLLQQKDLLDFKFEITPDTKRKGGLNLFGKSFGDYPQDILISITYRK